MSSEIEKLQAEFCSENGYEFLASPVFSITGYAVETSGKLPINGLRHLPVGQTNGWYIWRGEDFSKDENFFSPLHTAHLEKLSPEVIKLLGLPPGSRFLFASDYLDIWFDESLLVK